MERGEGQHGHIRKSSSVRPCFIFVFSEAKQKIIFMAKKIWKCVLLEKAAKDFLRIPSTVSPFDEGSLVRISLATALLEI